MNLMLLEAAADQAAEANNWLVMLMQFASPGIDFCCILFSLGFVPREKKIKKPRI